MQVAEQRDPAYEEHQRLRRRRVRRFLFEKQRGRRPKTRDERMLSVKDIIDIQSGLSVLLGGTYEYWRCVEAYSVILRMQRQRPTSPLTDDSEDGRLSCPPLNLMK